MKKFNLTKVEEKRYKEFRDAVKILHGEYGNYSFTFCNGGGIGVGVSVYSDLTKISKDITDYGSW